MHRHPGANVVSASFSAGPPMLQHAACPVSFCMSDGTFTARHRRRQYDRLAGTAGRHRSRPSRSLGQHFAVWSRRSAPPCSTYNQGSFTAHGAVFLGNGGTHTGIVAMVTPSPSSRAASPPCKATSSSPAPSATPSSSSYSEHLRHHPQQQRTLPTPPANSSCWVGTLTGTGNVNELLPPPALFFSCQGGDIVIVGLGAGQSTCAAAGTSAAAAPPPPPQS